MNLPSYRKLKDLQFASNSKTTFSFPFSVVYTSEIDPNNTVRDPEAYNIPLS
jgi:hypothetical protein